MDNSGNKMQDNQQVISLMCFSLFCSDKPQHVNDRVAFSNKIFLPESMLYMFNQEMFPLYFKLTHPEYGVSCVCAVEEFTAPPGCFIAPQRVMEQLLICDGNNINIQLCHPLKGTYIKLKPRKTAFIELTDPKAVLERHLSRDYPVVSTGDTISIKHANSIYHIDVVECKPADSIDILNTDINMDFDTPDDYVEPSKINNDTSNALNQSFGQSEQNSMSANKQNSMSANKLDSASDSAADSASDSASNTSYCKRNKKLAAFKSSGFVPFSGKGNRLGTE